MTAGNTSVAELLPDLDTLRSALDRVDYLADDGTVMALFCASRLGQPVLIEGEPGVGKTEAAKALAAALDTPLVRLQCYEGIDVAEALYEWNYPRQLLAIRLAEARGIELAEDALFSDGFLIARPLLAALRHPGPRGVPARIAWRGSGHHSRTRYRACDAPTDRRADVEPHKGTARRAEAALPFPLDRLSAAGACG